MTDWKLSINKCDLWGLALVDSRGTPSYTIYVRDIYDYEVGDSQFELLEILTNIAVGSLAEMPHFGLAKPYKVLGSATF